MLTLRVTVEERPQDVSVFVDLGVEQPANDQEWAFLSGVVDNFLARLRKVEARALKPLILSASQPWLLQSMLDLERDRRI